MREDDGNWKNYMRKRFSRVLPATKTEDEAAYVYRSPQKQVVLKPSKPFSVSACGDKTLKSTTSMSSIAAALMHQEPYASVDPQDLLDKVSSPSSQSLEYDCDSQGSH